MTDRKPSEPSKPKPRPDVTPDFKRVHEDLRDPKPRNG